MAYGAEFLRWFSEEAVRVSGSWLKAPAGGSRLLTLRKPVGPCLFITPWNFPLAMGTRKIGPAFAAGCTVIVKPAANTPLTMVKLAEVFAEAGLPEGVLQIVTTSESQEVSAALMADARLRKVSFTGSTAVGKKLVAQAAENLQRVSMELGGNAPFLVFGDADVDAAVDGAMIAKMRNMGEACTSANRFLVHTSVAEEFTEKLGERMGALTVGRGQDEGVDVGPLIDEKAVDRRRRAGRSEAVDGGARVVTGGGARRTATSTRRPCWPTYPPTPGSTARRSSARSRRSPRFETDDEAVRMANDTEYGLASYVYTALARPHPVGHRAARVRAWSA